MDVLQAVEKRIQNVVKSKGLELVETQFAPRGNGGLLRVTIDKEEGVTIDDCTEVSRELGPLLDAEGVFASRYTLEVSSPGVDKPLKTARDFMRNTGRTVKVQYRQTDANQKVLTGKVLGVENDVVNLEGKETTHQVPLASVVHAKVELQF